MKYAVLFSLLGVACLAGAAGYGGWYWLMLWPGVSFLLVGLAYAKLGPRVFGKIADGRMRWWSVLILLPFLLLTWGTWSLRRLLVTAPAVHQVKPGLYLSRRLLPGELPAEVRVVVDLTAEFPEPRGIRERVRYHACPCLDALVPGEAQLRALIDQLRSEPEPLLIHCANGHGRSAMVVAAVLIARGEFQNQEEAEEFLKQCRPGVGLTPAQRQLIARLFPPPAPATASAPPK